VLVGLVATFWAFYALAGLAAKGAVALGLPGYRERVPFDVDRDAQRALSRTS